MNDNPLTKTDMNTARTGVYECRVSLQECDRCEACGLDVTEERARAEHLKGFFQAILDNYSPQQSAPSS